jgi:hypothetical protein
MKLRSVIRIAGPIIGAVGFVITVQLVRGLWGYAIGFVVFIACAWISDRMWRRSATPEEIRADLEARARDMSA